MNNAAGNDMYITGGAIATSDYEENMSPEDQQKYETILMDEFMSAYTGDPYKGDLDFTHWLKSLNLDLVRERARKFEEIKAENNGLRKLQTMQDGRVLEDAAMIQRLAHLHTGRVEDLVDIVSIMEVPAGVSAFTASEPRRPQGSMPPQVAPDTAPPVGTEPQDILDYGGTNKELFNKLGRDYKD